MPYDCDIDNQVKRFWQRVEKKCPELAELEKELNATFEVVQRGFWNPSDKKPMRVAYFLKFLEDEPLVEVMKRYYKHHWKIKYLKPLGKTIIFMILERKNPYRCGQHLKEHPEDARDLGFEKLPNGKYKVISGKTLWYNLRKRFGIKGIREIVAALRECIRKTAENRCIQLGKNIGSDAFPIEAVSSDKNAEYSGYYELDGYKAVSTIDLDTNIPLVGEVIGINDSEGERLIPHIMEIKTAGMKPEDGWVDGGFTATKNISLAYSEGVELHFKIEQDWVYHPEATSENIYREYQKYHNEPDFVVGSSVNPMLYLVKKEDYDMVGNLIRNGRMAEYEEAPDSYLDVFHKRNRDESMNNHHKNDLDMTKRIKRKGKETVEMALLLTMLGLLAVAFVKLSHGITTDLVSLDGLV